MADTMKATPIKRHEALVQFSREHHYGLLLCWKIRQGIKKNIEAKRIAGYTLFFFENDLKKHFAEEEATLFTKLPPQDPLQQQAMSEHEKIYSLIEKIRENAGYEILNDLADTLDAHIRFEERTLFNVIQKNLSDEELIELVNNHRHVACNIDEQWNDQFWK